MKIKFLTNGIKIDDNYYPCNYGYGYWDDKRVSIFVLQYGKVLPRGCGLEVINDSDSREDYFEHDHIYLYPNDKYYKDAFLAYISQEAKLLERVINKMVKDGRKRDEIIDYEDRLCKVNSLKSTI